jgi:hypothetical protein
MEQELVIFDTQNALHYINDKELNDVILKMGSFLSIINSKKINQTQLFIEIVNSTTLCGIILEITGLNTLEQFVKEMVLRYPVIAKSKTVRNNIKKHAKRKTKKNI